MNTTDFVIIKKKPEGKPFLLCFGLNLRSKGNSLEKYAGEGFFHALRGYAYLKRIVPFPGKLPRTDLGG
jgi:hypothetical protein